MVEEKSNVTRLCYVKRMECGSMLSIAVLARQFLLISMNSNFCHRILGAARVRRKLILREAARVSAPAEVHLAFGFAVESFAGGKSSSENHHDVRSAVCTVVTSDFMADDSDP